MGSVCIFFKCLVAGSVTAVVAVCAIGSYVGLGGAASLGWFCAKRLTGKEKKKKKKYFKY